MIFDGIQPAPTACNADQRGRNAFQGPGAGGCPQVNAEAQGYEKYQQKKELQDRQDRMAAVGGLQIAEQNVILYPVDNGDDDSNEDQQETTNVGAQKSADVFPAQLFCGRSRKQRKGAPDNDGVYDIDHPRQSLQLQRLASEFGFILGLAFFESFQV